MNLSPGKKAQHTAKWARTMTKWLITFTRRSGARWNLVDFGGRTKVVQPRDQRLKIKLDCPRLPNTTEQKQSCWQSGKGENVRCFLNWRKPSGYPLNPKMSLDECQHASENAPLSAS